MAGGGDADVFVFVNAGDSAAGPARDVIRDFVSGVDQIDLSQVQTGMVFLGNAAFQPGLAGQVRYNVVSEGVQIDLDGDRVADMEIRLVGGPGLVLGDLIL